MDRRAHLHEFGFTELHEGRPDWELCYVVERLYKKYHQRIVTVLEGCRDVWMDRDVEDSDAPGASRVGGWAAAVATRELKGTGLYVYAAHPSVECSPYPTVDDDNYVFTGPRWYVSTIEAIMEIYKQNKAVPPPPLDLQELLWPCIDDRGWPMLTEAGWTIVPENSHPQMLHADICSSQEPVPEPREDQGRFLHLIWKPNPSAKVTTNFVPGSFVEGNVEWEHYEQLVQSSAAAAVFDSEVLHCGARTGAVGWSSSLTIQTCSQSGWDALNTGGRASAQLLEFTFTIGLELETVMDAKLDDGWQPAILHRRVPEGYELRSKGSGVFLGVRKSCDLRFLDGKEIFYMGSSVEVLREGEWCPAKVKRRHRDGTYRVALISEKTIVDAVQHADLRSRPGGYESCSDVSTCSSSDVGHD